MTTAFALVVSSAAAQYRIEMSERITRDEVPIVVQRSLEKKLDSRNADGTWELFYIETTIENSHDAKFDPEFYSYSFKENGERMEYFFKPDGTLYKVKEEESKGNGK